MAVRAYTHSKYQPEMQYDHNDLLSVFNRNYFSTKKYNKLAYEEVILLGENRSERAIIILDMINEFAHIEGKRYEAATLDIIPYVQGELQYFRERMRPVVFCNTHAGENPSELSDASRFDREVIQALSPRTGEICLKKSRPNAFFGTELSNTLHGLKVRKLTIVGAFSHTSVLVTAAAAIDHGFSVVVPETCVCAGNVQDHAAALRLINRWLNE